MPRSRFATYAELAKSGIVALVVISVLGGYLVGHRLEAPFDFKKLLATLFGILFLASGSSALNQIQERQIDASMLRTAKRPLPSGRISLASAWVFVLVTVASGLFLLDWVDRVQLYLGLCALISYNGLYTLWWKKHWSYAAVPGAIPGALPILMGHAAGDGSVTSPGGLYLFFLLFFWQMPHFWVLALKYREDYAQGGFPTLPVTHGSTLTVARIGLWALAYVALSLVAPLFLPVRTFYLIVALGMGAKLLWELRGFQKAPESRSWLRFFLWVNFSLIAYVFAAVADLWGVYLRAWITQ
jgi:protoheme IX farnesyltransferase